MSKPISDHEGRKYLRIIRSCVDGRTIQVDVYDVLKAFNVTCQATGHAIKKLLCGGLRGKGNRLADLIGAEAALSRAIDEEKRDTEQQSDDNNKEQFNKGDDKRYACDGGFRQPEYDPKEYE